MKFRKKPVVVEAEKWFFGMQIEGLLVPKNYPNAEIALIKTLEGEMQVSPGDWIITGVKGEKYPCKPDIFEMTYEPIENELELIYTEVCRQPYLNCAFSAGFVDGHPYDTMYVKWEREGEDDLVVLMRPDEMAALAWVINGALWSDLISKVEDAKNDY